MAAVEALSARTWQQVDSRHSSDQFAVLYRPGRDQNLRRNNFLRRYQRYFRTTRMDSSDADEEKLESIFASTSYPFTA